MLMLCYAYLTTTHCWKASTRPLYYVSSPLPPSHAKASQRCFFLCFDCMSPPTLPPSHAKVSLRCFFSCFDPPPLPSSFAKASWRWFFHLFCLPHFVTTTTASLTCNQSKNFGYPLLSSSHLKPLTAHFAALLDCGHHCMLLEKSISNKKTFKVWVWGNKKDVPRMCALSLNEKILTLVINLARKANKEATKTQVP